MSDEMRYRVLWFDDDHAAEKLDHIPKKARKAGIDLVGYASAAAGEQELMTNHRKYDAVILDGLFFEEEGMSGDAVDESALVKVKNTLLALAAQTHDILPEFVLSGQPSVLSEANAVLKVHKVSKVYDKNSDEDIAKLWLDIKAAAADREATQIRHRYQRVFEICTERYIGDAAAEHLLTILRNVNGVDSELKDDLYFNHLRKCLEWLFRAANRQGLLHDECIAKGEVNLRCSSLFMAGKEVNVLGVKCAKAHFPPLIAEHVRYILDVTNAHSHTESWEQEQARMQLEQYRATVRSPYLLFSLTFMLLDVLLWYKQYADAHPNAANNRSHWQDLVQPEGLSEEQMGIVINKNTKGFAFFKPDSGAENAFIPPPIVADNTLDNAMRVAVRTKLADKGPEVSSLRVIGSTL
jgi:cold shock CspA family protein